MNSNTLNIEFSNIINKEDISFDSSLNEENTCDNFNSSFEIEESNDNSISLSDISDFEDDYENRNNQKANKSNTKEKTLSTVSQIHLSIASTLLNLIKKENQYPHLPNETSSFYSETIPSISIYDYLNRIITYTEIDDKTLIIALIYIDKYCTSNSHNKPITNHIIHKLLFTAIILAIKYNEDIIYNNQYYAEIGGISLQELNKLEYELLVELDFSLFIDNDLFLTYDTALRRHLGCK